MGVKKVSEGNTMCNPLIVLIHEFHIKIFGMHSPFIIIPTAVIFITPIVAIFTTITAIVLTDTVSTVTLPLIGIATYIICTYSRIIRLHC